jgi:hypothetical protein
MKERMDELEKKASMVDTLVKDVSLLRQVVEQISFNSNIEFRPNLVPTRPAS